MTFACEWHSQMQSVKILCLSLLFTKSRMGLLVGVFFWSWDRHFGSACAAFRLLLWDRDGGRRRGRCWDGLRSNKAVPQPRPRLRRHSTVAHWQRKARENYLPLLSWLARILFSGLFAFQRCDPDWSKSDWI